MEVSYCKSWFRACKKPTEVWTADQAEAAHKGGKLYTALLSDAGTPKVFIELTKNYVGVGFLDCYLREYSIYQFQMKDGNRLFLSMAVHREYHGDLDTVKNAMTYFFSPDGRVRMDRSDLENGVKESSEVIMSVGKNWEEFPKFGDYEAVAKFER